MMHVAFLALFHSFVHTYNVYIYMGMQACHSSSLVSLFVVVAVSCLNLNILLHLGVYLEGGLGCWGEKFWFVGIILS